MFTLVGLLVASVPAPSVQPLATNVTKCLADHCKAQVAACTKDSTCNAGITCVVACKPATKACVEGCVEAHLDQTMLEIGLCAEAAHCISSDLHSRFPAHDVEAPDCDSIASEDKCHAQGCSWCKSAAVPSSCKTKEEAKGLPPAVFDCA